MALGVWSLLLAGFAVAVKRGWLLNLDHGAAGWMDALRHPALDGVVAAVTFFGSSPWTAAVVAVMVAWWLRQGRRTTAAVFLAAGGIGLILQSLLRFWVGQWRPDVAAVPAAMDLVTRYDLAGFTSGHAFRSAFLSGWWSLALLTRGSRGAAAGVVGCVLLALLVGLTRIYLRRHWLTDVVGAWLVAAVALSAVVRLRRRA